MTTLAGPTGTLLGARVRLDDGTPGEVWALAPRRRGDTRDRVWVAVGTRAHDVAVNDLRPEHDQPTLIPEEKPA